MKKMLVAAVVVLVAGLFVWQWHRNAVRLASLQQQTVTLQHETEQLKQESASIHQRAAELRASASAMAAQSQAMKDQVEAERSYAAHEKARYIRAAYIAEGFQVADQVKTMIAEYYIENGHWPDSNGALDLPAPDAYKARALRSMNVSRHGVIVLNYGAVSGLNGGKIRLAPLFDKRTQQIKWRCRTTTYRRISSIVPQCVYVGPEDAGS